MQCIVQLVLSEGERRTEMASGASLWAFTATAKSAPDLKFKGVETEGEGKRPPGLTAGVLANLMEV